MPVHMPRCQYDVRKSVYYMAGFSFVNLSSFILSTRLATFQRTLSRKIPQKKKGTCRLDTCYTSGAGCPSGEERAIHGSSDFFELSKIVHLLE